MSEFERLKYFYEKGWASEEKLREYVRFKMIDENEFKLITGLDY